MRLKIVVTAQDIAEAGKLIKRFHTDRYIKIIGRPSNWSSHCFFAEKHP
jgi:hypothetical protein